MCVFYVCHVYSVLLLVFIRDSRLKMNPINFREKNNNDKTLIFML